MSKTVKSLLRLSMVVRNLGTLNNCTTIKRFIQTSSTCSSNYYKDSLVSPRHHLVSQDSQSLSQATSLQHLLRNTEDENEIFRIISENSNKMSGADAVHVLEALFNVYKLKSQKTVNLCKNGEFLTLCEILKKNVHKLSTNEIIATLKSLIFFGVPTSSVIVNLVLQIIRHSINNLSLQQIVFIDFLLSKCQKTPLVEALTIALPIVHEANVLLKLDRENMNSIVMALKYLSKKSTNSDIFAVIIEAINKCPQQIDPHSAKSILWSLCDLKCFPEGIVDAISCVQNVLAQNITSVDRQTIKQVLYIISEKIKFRESYFYHEGFADASASIVVSEDWGFVDAVNVLEKLITMNHVQISLLDYIAAKCYEDPTILQKCLPSHIATIALGFSNADYKPAFWDMIRESMMSERMLEGSSIQYPLSKLAISLASLDCYYPQLLAKVFSLNQQLSLVRRGERGKLLLLYQAAKTLYPQYEGPWPTESIVNFLSMRFKCTDDDYPLISYLECALGGRRYVMTNIRTKLGHHIDHALIMRKGGFPIAINSDVDTESSEYPLVMMEDLQPPADSQVILVMYMPSYAYSINNQRMKGAWLLQIKTLVALSGYTVIPIQSTMWTGLPEPERIPYLMQAIKLKCDEISVSASS